MIELKQVSFCYRGQEQGGLHDVDLTVTDGECVLLCGRSGCGKTTVTRLINGLIPPFLCGRTARIYRGEWAGDDRPAYVSDC